MSDNEFRTPSEWETETGIRIKDPDGWDRSNLAEDWAKPITRAEFMEKANQSTVEIPAWQRAEVDRFVAIVKAANLEVMQIILDGLVAMREAPIENLHQYGNRITPKNGLARVAGVIEGLTEAILFVEQLMEHQK